MAAFLWDVTTDIDAVRETSAAQAAEMGLRALELASDTRKAFKLPQRSAVFGVFDVRKILEEHRQNDQENA